MPDQVPEEIKERRSRILLDMNRQSIRRYETGMYGRTLEVLIEERRKIGDAFYMTGHSREYIPVAVPEGEGTVSGRILQIPVTGHLDEHLLY
jgi:threonylcarbamoyladenosine tRNA methylthiotransferase MtaB